MRNFDKKIHLVEKTYFFSDKNMGADLNNKKGDRPYYILCSIDNDWVFAVVGTTTKHIGKKKTYQSNNKYIEWKKGAYLRVNLENGWHYFKKEELKNNKNNLKEYIKISKGQKEELLKFYNSTINDQKKILKNKIN